MNSQHQFSSAFEQFLRARKNTTPPWLITNHWQRGEKLFAEKGYPTRKEEKWHYTSLQKMIGHNYELPPSYFNSQFNAVTLAEEAFFQRLKHPDFLHLVFLDGAFCKSLSDLEALQIENLQITDLPQALANENPSLLACLNKAQGVGENAFTHLNDAFCERGIFIKQSGEIESSVKPVKLVFLSRSSEKSIYQPLRVIALIEKNSCGLKLYVQHETLLSPDLELGAPSLKNSLFDLFVHENSKIFLAEIQAENENIVHKNQIRVWQEKHSVVESFLLHLGGSLVRHDLNFFLQDKGAEIYTSGLYLPHREQHMDISSEIYHEKPETVSEQFFKGAMHDEASGVFSGKIVVSKEARKTRARQLNKNLLLSAKATANTRPQLEINQDDVKCSHGATVSRFREDEKLYLLNRGLTEKKALQLLAKGFSREVIYGLKQESEKPRLLQFLEQFFDSQEIPS